MSTHKWIDRICAGALALALVLTVLFMNGEALGIKVVAATLGYENRLFDNTRVHSLDIVIDDWDSFIATAQNEVYEMCTVVIDGEKYSNVAIRAKGNTSLMNVTTMGSQRYSFKIEFDHYDSTKSYHGLDKLSLNNMIQDNTMMKDYLAYTLMAEFGAPAPLCSFVFVTVNGEDFGLYLAVEAVEDSFVVRTYGSTDGDLYKPDTLNMGGGDEGGDAPGGSGGGEEPAGEAPAGDGGSQGSEGGEPAATEPAGEAPAVDGGSQGSEGGEPAATEPAGEAPAGDGGSQGSEGGEPTATEPAGEAPAGDGGSQGSEGGEPAATEPAGEAPTDDGGSSGGGENPGGGGSPFGMGGSYASLEYMGDDPASYSGLFASAKTDITEEDQLRMVEALKILDTGSPESVDMDRVIRYFVVHNYVVNGDSYTGGIIHNYYLHEEDGILSMIAWDYNLGFGTFTVGDTSGSINDDIDRPQSVSGDGRPMIDWMLNNEEYRELYHTYFQEFLDTVDPVAIVEAAYELIAPYVEKDPTKFCSYEDFETGVEAMKAFCKLRSQSVQLQLSGSNANVDTGDLDLSDLGAMGDSGNGGGGDSSGGGEETDNTNPSGGGETQEGTENPSGGGEQPADPTATAPTGEAPAGDDGSEGSEGGDATATAPTGEAPAGDGGSEGSEGGDVTATAPTGEAPAGDGGSEGSEGGDATATVPAGEAPAENADPSAGGEQPTAPADSKSDNSSSGGEPQEGGQRPEDSKGGFPGQSGTNMTQGTNRWELLAITAAVLAAGLLAAFLFKR